MDLARSFPRPNPCRSGISKLSNRGSPPGATLHSSSSRVQSEGGIRIPDADYLSAAQALCRHYGSLFVLDEVQTGMYRTGPFLAAHHFGLDPDIVVLAKALSGGLIPVSATLMSDAVSARFTAR